MALLPKDCVLHHPSAARHNRYLCPVTVHAPSPSNPSLVVPRPYQDAACTCSWNALENRPACLIVSPTGTGKTVIFGTLVSRAVRASMRVLILVHGDQLVRQNARRMREEQGLVVDIEMADRCAQLANKIPTADVVVASIDTLRTPGRIKRFDRFCFDLIIVDEADEGYSDGFLMTYDYFCTARRIGVTATPDQDTIDTFDHIAFEYSTPEAIRDGWLVNADVRMIRVEALDLSQIRVRDGEFDKDELQAAMTVKAMTEMVEPSVRALQGITSMMFTASVTGAHAAAEIFRRYGATAGVVDGRTRGKRRDAVLEPFGRGKLQYVTNCDVLTRGFDCPRLGGLIMGAPVLSWSRYMQRLGRGLRPLKGVVDGLDTAEERRAAIARSSKPHLKLLDFVDSSGRHDLVRACDALDPEMAPAVRNEVLKLTEENTKDGQGTTVSAEASRLSNAMVLEIAKECELPETVAFESVVHKFASQRDPDLQTAIDFYQVPRVSDRMNRNASDKQVSAIRKFGISAPDEMDKRQAGAMLDRLIMRAKAGLARPKQVRFLISRGTKPEEAMSLSMEEASKRIDKAVGRGRPRYGR